MNFRRNVPLKKYSNYKIGGPADYFFEFKTKEELANALNLWDELKGESDRFLVLGKGTNILFDDDGFRGLVLKNSIDFIERKDKIVLVGAGTLFSDLVSYFVQNSFSGLEWAGGLPGTVGGAIRGNAGAFGGETKDDLVEVESIEVDSGKIKTRKNLDCLFEYRQSAFKSGDGENEVITSAKFGFKRGNKEEVKNKTQERIDYRIDRHPLDLPNIGSTFKNVPVEQVPVETLDQFKDNIKNDPFPVLPVAKLLAGLDLKGRVVGGAKISEKHPNFIVNFNNAKAKDVLELIKIAKREVMNRYSIELEPEILILSS